MITYFLFIKLKGFFRSLRNPWKILSHIIFILIAWFYAKITSSVINHDIDSGESPDMMIYYVSLFIMAVTIIRMIFPKYTLQKQHLPNYYPLTKFQHYFFSLISEFTASYFFYFSIFIISISWLIDYSNFKSLYFGLSALISAHLIRRLIQYLIENRLKSTGYISFIVTLLIFSIIIIYIDFFLDYLNYLAILIPVYLFIAGFIMDLMRIERKKIEFFQNSKHGYIYLKLIIRNPAARMALVMGFSMKLLFIIGDFYRFKTDGEHLFDEHIFYWILFSPLLLYTYVYNNTWGFWKNLWLNLEVRSGYYQDMVLVSLRLLAIPLFIDILITLPFLLYVWDDYVFILLFYSLSILFLSFASMFWSVVSPIPVKSTFQLRNTSSFLGGIISMISVTILSLMKLNYWFYIFIPIYLVLSVVVYKAGFSIYKERKYKIIQKLIKM